MRPTESTWSFNATTQSQVDAIFSEWATTTSPGMTLGIYRYGEPVYTQAYGMSNLEHNIPLSPGSIFHIASISKQFTDCCIGMLAAEGLLSIDDDIRRYLSEVPDFGPTITIRHLMHHTSGLRDQWQLLNLSGWREEDLVTDDDVLYLVERQQALNFVPNSEYLYSNTGYTLLSIIVKRVSGLSLRAFAQERIFGPLGMTSTHFQDDHSEIVPGRTQAYQPRTGGGYFISVPEFDVVGTTSLFTTVEDLAKWEANYHTPTVGGAELIAQMQQPGLFNDGSPMDYAWGLRVEEWRGAHRVGHSGADHGYRADFLRLPAFGFAVAVLSNISNSAPNVLTEQVAGIVLGDVLTPAAGKALAPTGATVELESFIGTWQEAGSGQFLRITEADGMAWIDASIPQKLEPLTDGGLGLPVFRLAITLGSMPDTLALSLAGKTSLLERAPEWHPSVDELAAYLGSYWSDELAVAYDIILTEGEAPGLAIRRRKFDDEAFVPLDSDRFVRGSLDFGTALEFERDSNGEVIGFQLTAGRIRNLVFNRRHQ